MSTQSFILLVLLASLSLGGLLWWRSIGKPAPESSSGTPDVYTIENVRQHRDHYIEQNGWVQAFILVETHPRSGYFQIEVIPPDEHLLNRDYQRIRGWTEKLVSNRLIRQSDLLKELPIEVRRVFSF